MDSVQDVVSDPPLITLFRKEHTPKITDRKHLGQFEFSLISCRWGQNGTVPYRPWSGTAKDFATEAHWETILVRMLSPILLLASCLLSFLQASNPKTKPCSQQALAILLFPS